MSSSVMLVNTPVMSDDCSSSFMATCWLMNPPSNAELTASVIRPAIPALSSSLNSHSGLKSSRKSCGRMIPSDCAITLYTMVIPTFIVLTCCCLMWS